MKKIFHIHYSLFILLSASALLLSSCGKKPAKQAEKPQEEAPVVTVDSTLFVDIKGLTPEGTELSLSDLVGETDYVLVDFWASWCGPCRRFIPVLKELYAGQEDGHFEILSCSVDQDVMAWQVALNEEQMPWPQIREDEDHMCSDKYNVQYIPHTVLIDKEGKIIGVNLEEPQIQEILFK